MFVPCPTPIVPFYPPLFPPGQVLLSAQEPLSHSMLQSMCLSAHLDSLPGWGCLFYQAEHHVYLLHKSLSDWLLDGRKSGAHAVDVGAGHRRLGIRLLKDVEAMTPPEVGEGSGKGQSVKTSLPPRRSLPAYASKYAVLHLARGGQQVAPMLDRGGRRGGTGVQSTCNFQATQNLTWGALIAHCPRTSTHFFIPLFIVMLNIYYIYVCHATT